MTSNIQKIKDKLIADVDNVLSELERNQLVHFKAPGNEVGCAAQSAGGATKPFALGRTKPLRC
jgi:hypothetical protein